MALCLSDSSFGFQSGLFSPSTGAGSTSNVSLTALGCSMRVGLLGLTIIQECLSFV